MRLFKDAITLTTDGHGQVIDLTDKLENIIAEWGMSDGHGLLFMPGSTGGLTTIEYEPGVVKDLGEALEKFAPSNVRYHHDDAWGDGNGYAHLRAALVGPSVGFMVAGRKLVRGVWQQFVFCDFDNRHRERTINVTGTGVTESNI